MRWRWMPFLVFWFNLSFSYAQPSWPTVTKEMKPWTRWWWMGSAVDRPNLQRELQQFDAAGFGGVEVTPIYGAKGYESRYIPYLSERWLDMLNFTTTAATDLGLGVDMNLGTGWPFGGPTVQLMDAATKFLVEDSTLEKGSTLSFPWVAKDGQQSSAKLQALRAYTATGKSINLEAYIADNSRPWIAPEDVRIIALFSGKTGQRVKRAAPGGEGFTLDHLGASAVQHYFDTFRQAFAKRNVNLRAFFNDSYEVYGANWTDLFLTEFNRRKGYKLEDYLLDFSGNGSDKEKEARVKSDYREVVSAILQDNFLRPFTTFSHRYGAVSKNQAHGSPGNLIDLYGSTDIAECETFGSSSFAIPGLRRDPADVRNVDPDPMMFKFASSATHTLGKKYTSAETFTWLTDHFKTSLSQAKPEVEQLFLAGVNHVFYHGSTYSPKDIDFPGWLFYASVNFTANNSFWPHLSGLNSYVTRVQSILQTTQADNELLVYWPIYDVWHDTEAPFKTLGVHHVDQWLHPSTCYKQSVRLQRAGYSFDFVSDAILAQSTVKSGKIVTAEHAQPYKTLYVPASHFFSEETFRKLLELANAGATIIFEALPKDVAGLNQLEPRRAVFRQLLAQLPILHDAENQYCRYGKGKIYITKDMLSALETEEIFAERLVQSGLKFSRRVANGSTYYYMVNHSEKMIDESVRLNRVGLHYTLLDPQTGQAFTLLSDKGKIRLQLPSGYAWIVQVANQEASLPTYAYMDNLQEQTVFTAAWRVSFTTGGPVLPKSRRLKELSFWTDWHDTTADKFGGTASYETEIELQKQQSKAYLLTLGQLAESARVLVNGQEAGMVWSYPFQIEIGQLLRNGKNTIRIEVANLMANRVRELDRQHVPWRNYHEINFVNIDYKPFDASQWPLQDSGLKGPVQLFVY
ncbi:glycosyl hydrolase [Sphingobacterium oryzagri]|uniref:Glycosyl hydrolase n=1 Tax=Sphingobacterium oryzagri TaxID=3025669 RepID=A0ABY7WHA1_9SPHI|nr:glycosyl hydrolase [Sphingobacterium sp. KACC 22765]WDF68280.1 glycosyl hydrolase [Sphingobacterium sp. KACC 22765]